MYLSRIRAVNFRRFGDEQSGTHLDLQLDPQLNVIVGENDSGKSSVIDAIRLVLGSRGSEWQRITRDDFHLDGGERAGTLWIECELAGLDQEEASAFLEWLGISVDDEGAEPEFTLKVRLQAERRELAEPRSRFDREILVSIRAGPDAEGSTLDGAAREALSVPYLRALRDAEQELQARRGSRLSQILLAHPAVLEGDQALRDIMLEANEAVKAHESIQARVRSLNEDYLSRFLLGGDRVAADIDIAPPQLRHILESLRLFLMDDTAGAQSAGVPPGETEVQGEFVTPDTGVAAAPATPSSGETTRHGLGLNNLLFMATELLLLQSPLGSSAPLVLIEEPEAHLHPQFQLRLIEFLERQTRPAAAGTDMRSVQVILTTHSPNLASKVDLKHLTLLRQGRCFPMGPGHTRLTASDYGFLQRFLDVTRANLFFARGVLMVEGTSEALLLPTIADLSGRSFTEAGVSVVNVGHLGFFRYARIFERQDGRPVGICAACLTDLDIPPDEADYIKEQVDGRPRTAAALSEGDRRDQLDDRRGRSRTDTVPVFVSPQWTLEHDIAAADIDLARAVHMAVQLAIASGSRPQGLDEAEKESVKGRASEEFSEWMAAGCTHQRIAAAVYRPLYERRASKPEAAQYLASLLEEHVDARAAIVGLAEAQSELRLMLPRYLVDAIEWVTGDTEGTE